MIIPFIFLSDQSQVKFFVNGRNRNIKSINFLCHSITVCHSIRCWLKKLCSILLCVFCSSYKKIHDIFGSQTYMKCHFSIFDCQCTFSIICFIYMEHSTVCIKFCTVNAVFQDLTFCSIFFFIVCFCSICLGFSSILVCCSCRNCFRFCLCQNRTVTTNHECSA